MKDTDITIIFNSEKLDALNFYMGKKESEVQRELEETVQNLYLKHVPAPTREYIEDRLERESGSQATTRSSKKAVPSVKKRKKSEETKQPEQEETVVLTSEEVENTDTQDGEDSLVSAFEEEVSHSNSDADQQENSGSEGTSEDSANGFLDGLLN